MINFHEDLQLTQSLIEPILKAYLQDKGNARLLEAASYSLLGKGKRFRAHLTRVTADLLNIDRPISLQLGAVLEMVHAYSLIHDDLPAMDNASLRRGQPTTHLVFDEATALLTGNSLLTKAIEILTLCPFDAAMSLRLIKELTQAIGFDGMMSGQMIDMVADCQTLADLETMETLKTGYLLAFAIKAPLMIAQVPNVEDHPLISLAHTFGLVFQMIDDVLDVTQDTPTLGKPSGLDQHNGKTTFVTLLGLQETKKRAHYLMDNALSRIPADINPHGLWNGIGHFILNRQQ